MTDTTTSDAAAAPSAGVSPSAAPAVGSGISIDGLTKTFHTGRGRTVTALQYKKTQNQKTGGAVPYGFDLDADGVHLIENDAEQRVIAQARELHASGLSLRKIAAELNARGLMARNGRTFQATQIMRMVA